MAEEDWGDIFTNLRMSACRGRLQLFARQFFAEKKIDIGEDNEDYVENMLKEEEKIAIAGLTNTLPLRTLSLPWLPKARRTAIYNIVFVMKIENPISLFSLLLLFSYYFFF